MSERDQENFQNEFKNLEPRTRFLAEDFYEAVVSSEEFLWMGLFNARDSLQRSRLVIYLADVGNRPATPLPERVSPGRTFTKLAIALQPRILLDMYYLEYKENELPVTQAVNDANARYEKASLIWQESFS